VKHDGLDVGHARTQEVNTHKEICIRNLSDIPHILLRNENIDRFIYRLSVQSLVVSCDSLVALKASA
jgi:hypothetical protein